MYVLRGRCGLGARPKCHLALIGSVEDVSFHPCRNLVSDFGSRMKGNVVSELLKLLMHRFQRKLGFDDLCLAFWEQREKTIKSIDRSSISVSQRSKPTQEGCPHRVLQILCREW